MQTQEYVTRGELKQAEQEFKRGWKMTLVLLLLGRRQLRAVSPVETQQTEKPAPQHPGLERTILFVDKDPFWASQLSQTLSHSGFKAIMTGNCAEGLARLSEASPDLVLLDIDLTDSREAYEKIREQVNVPIILLGSYSDNEGWSKAAEWGADAYLRRSMGTLELTARIKAILRRYQKDETL